MAEGWKACAPGPNGDVCMCHPRGAVALCHCAEMSVGAQGMPHVAHPACWIWRFNTSIGLHLTTARHSVLFCPQSPGDPCCPLPKPPLHIPAHGTVGRQRRDLRAVPHICKMRL